MPLIMYLYIVVNLHAVSVSRSRRLVSSHLSSVHTSDFGGLVRAILDDMIFQVKAKVCRSWSFDTSSPVGESH